MSMSSSKYVCNVNVLLRTTVCSKNYNGSYLQGGYAMEAFLVLVVLIFGKEMKVLLCSRIEKEIKVKEDDEIFCVEKRNMKTRKVK